MDNGLQLFTFEVAMEVANKVGGIYTVLRTKAGVTVDELGEDYCMVGIANEKFVAMEVEKMEFAQPALRGAVEEMRNQNFGVISGRWLIEGYPKVILFDLDTAYRELTSWKWDFFDKTNIGIPDHDHESHRAILFGFLTVALLGLFRERCGPNPVVISHFHEWLAGVGLVMTRARQIDVSTIFTTHATLLGRYLCAANIDFYNNLDKFHVDKEAGDRQIYHRYCMERAAANAAHVFTTVSAITAFEAHHLLKRRPDLILPNGLNIKDTQCIHEFQNLHAVSKEKIHNFVRGHFYGHFDLDLDKTLYLFIAGRYEYTNKGADVFIEALARLNHRMKLAGSDVTFVAFLIFPGATNNFNIESLKGQAVVRQLRESVNVIKETIAEKVFDKCLRGNLPTNDELLSRDEIITLKRCMYANQCRTLPPIVTHNILNDGEDPILNQLRSVQLFNKKEDRVKVIFHPEFLNQTSPLLPMDYDDFVRGCHMGVFPSYYEPWGYTPAECAVKGIPSITTNLSGFGCFMESHLNDPQAYGIYIMDRRFMSPDSSCNQLVDFLFSFSQMTRRERIIQRNRTERLSELLDWGRLGMYYTNARRLAIERTHPEFLERGPGFVSSHSPAGSVRLPRPYSAPGSPFGSRPTSPHPSEDDDDERKFVPYDEADSGLTLRSNIHSIDTESTGNSEVNSNDLESLSKLSVS
ncbi:glycogen [starch] synthase, muscle-like [Styela clava]